MPEPDASLAVRALLRRARRTLRVAAVLSLITAGAAVAGAVAGLGFLSSWSADSIRIIALAAGILTWAAAGTIAARHLTSARAAALLEQRTLGPDNALVTAEELLRSSERLHPSVTRAVFEQASRRAAGLSFEPRRELAGPALQGLASAAAVALLLAAMPLASTRRPHETRVEQTTQAAAAATLTVTVQPPAYTGEAPQHLHEPQQLRVREGSVVQLRVGGSAPPLELLNAGQDAVRFDRDGDLQVAEVVARASMFPLVRAVENRPWPQRSLGILVEPDLPPSVRVKAPGRDLAFNVADATIALELQAEDDLGLQALALRYTVVSGSGETFTFEERTLPLHIARSSRRAWQGHGVLRLESLELEAGDAIVYRAVANDSRPGSPPVLSESYLIEIGSVAGVSSSGFALPEDRDRHALSQQMVIVKTERLLASAASLPVDELLEQARLLAVEQRMVRAEFVFMTGGEVQDEAEEAAHSHELAEGRFENEGARELLAAIREMSRAEARLNDGAVAQALPFERAALTALQRAFDRRRYFLKTLPERTRIDFSRRLSGDRSSAAPSTVNGDREVGSEQARRLRATLRLFSQEERWSGLLAELGSRVGALAPDDEAVRQAAARLAAAATASAGEQRQAVQHASAVLATRLRQQLSPAPTRTLAGAANPLR